MNVRISSVWLQRNALETFKLDSIILLDMQETVQDRCFTATHRMSAEHHTPRVFDAVKGTRKTNSFLTLALYVVAKAILKSFPSCERGFGPGCSVAKLTCDMRFVPRTVRGASVPRIWGPYHVPVDISDFAVGTRLWS